MDDFLRSYVTPALRARGFRKSSHTYRKRYTSGDWSIFSFRDLPRDFAGSFVADASLVPEPVWDWFRFTRPTLATKEPHGWWLEWSNPLGPQFATSNWTYETAGEKEVVGSRLVGRIDEVVDLFDDLCTGPSGSVERLLAAEPEGLERLPTLTQRCHSLVWRVCLTCRAGMTQDLEAVLREADAYPSLGLRGWVDGYTTRPAAISFTRWATVIWK